MGIFISHTRVSSLPLGTWGVSVFLVLSGFLMAIAYCEKTLDTGLVPSLLFSWKKIISLYPLHILTMLLTLPLLSRIDLTEILHMAANVTLLQTWSPESTVYYSLNSVAWYLSVCLFVYFIFPAILKKLQAATSTWQLLIGAAIVVMAQSALAYLSFRFRNIEFGNNFFKWTAYILPLSRAGDFIVGSIFGFIFLRRNAEENIHPAIASVLELAASALALTSILYSAANLNMSWSAYSVWYLPGSLLLVYAFAINKGILTKLLTNKITVWIGDLSAYGFLLHQMVIRYLAKYATKITGLKLGNRTSAALAFVVTIILSVLYKKYLAALLASP